MSSPFFTVIIPTHNRAGRLGKTIASVLNQDEKDFELIIVDDGSTDDTSSVVEAIGDDRIRYLWQENRERAAARNTGVSVSRGAYVTFLDSDDLLYPEHLRTVREALRSMGLPPVYHQAYEVIDDAGKLVSRLNIPGGRINRLLFTRGNIMSCQGVFVQRVILSDNRFNESPVLTGLEDWELWIRLAAHYPIPHGEVVTSALVQHKERSVMANSAEVLITRKNAFKAAIGQNKTLTSMYAEVLPVLWANISTYVSLHLSEMPSRKFQAITYLIQGIRQSPGILMRRRTWAILRNILLR